jgi:hypothetical protein
VEAASRECIDDIERENRVPVLMSATDEFTAERDRLRAWVNDLQSGMYVNCVYCGHRYGPGATTPVSMADALKAHIEQCPEHPMSEIRTRVAELEVSLNVACEVVKLRGWATGHADTPAQLVGEILAQADEEIAKLKAKLLVPGVMYCAKCDFTLTRTNLYVNHGTTGPGHSKSEPCPNGCGPLWPMTWEKQAAEWYRELEKRLEPIPMLLFCPSCYLQHVDAPEPGTDWTNPPHKSHLCRGCKTVWRPADVPTTGVLALATRGKADTWP